MLTGHRPLVVKCEKTTAGCFFFSTSFFCSPVCCNELMPTQLSTKPQTLLPLEMNHMWLRLHACTCVSISQRSLRIISSITGPWTVFVGAFRSSRHSFLSPKRHISHRGETPLVIAERAICSLSFPLSWSRCGTDCETRCEAERWDSWGVGGEISDVLVYPPWC